jgi:membrane-associated phospholipid phosphatase
MIGTYYSVAWLEASRPLSLELMASQPSSTTSQPTQRQRLMTEALLIGLLAAAVALALFSWLGREIILGVTLPLDDLLRDWVHALATPQLTKVMIAASLYGGPGWLVPLGVGLAIAFLVRGWRRGALLIVVTMAGTGLLDTVLKLSFGRTRPEAFFDYPLPLSHSFPSGHAFFSASLLGGFAVLISGRIRSQVLRALLWVVTIGLILLIGFSRVYLGVHYPSDVFAGYAAAVVWVTAVALGDRLASRRRPQRVA